MSGRLAPFAVEVRSGLLAAGYTPLTTVNRMRMMADLSRWLEAGGMSVADLTDQRVEEYLEVRRAAGRTAVSTRWGVAQLLDVLASLGVLPTLEAVSPRPSSSVEAVVASFRDYLVAERGLRSSTVGAHVRSARRRLLWSAPDGDLSGLAARDVTDAVVRVSEEVPASAAQYFACGRRAFLRFCFVEGMTAQDLSEVTLTVTGRCRSPLPRGIARDDVEALLASCDRRSSKGRRDYAVLGVLLRLGLRAGQVARLTLDDIDWRAGEVTVGGKRGREDRMPLARDVGEAIAAYLTRGRSKTVDRPVFLRTLAPIGPLGRGGSRRSCAEPVSERGSSPSGHIICMARNDGKWTG